MAELFARKLICAIRNNLVSVHIGLRARTRLPYDKRKMVVKPAGYHLVASSRNSRKLFLCHFFGFKLGVCESGCFFEYPESVCYFARHCLDADAYFKILMASLRLRRPKSVGGNLHFTH